MGSGQDHRGRPRTAARARLQRLRPPAPGRWIDVAPRRFVGWVERFVDAHGPCEASRDGDRVRITAADGFRAVCDVPFPPVPLGELPATTPIDARVAAPVIAQHAAADRRFGLLLVRRGGYAVGVAHGGALVTSKVGTRYVQSRTAAGGWSQQRYARRREGQARELVEAVADVAVRLLLVDRSPVAAVVSGGDRTLAQAVLADRRLARLAPLLTERFLAVADPRLAVLKSSVEAAAAIRVQVTPPPPGDATSG